MHKRIWPEEVRERTRAHEIDHSGLKVDLY